MTWAVGASLIATAFLVSVEVVLRKVFLIGLSMATEISSYALAIAASWGFAFALLARAHVRVDALVRLLPTRAAAWFDLLALVGLFGFAAALAWYGFMTVAESWELNARAMTPLGTRLWIPQGLWFFGLFFFALTAAALLVRSVVLLVQGKSIESRVLIGTNSVAEESVAEVDGLVKREGDGP